MDKAISQEEIVTKKRRSLAIGATIVVLLIAAIWLMRFFLHSSVSVKEITTAVVERGDVENTINASGEILPEFEGVITSPINASIQNVIIDVGSPVKTGQSILTLD